MSWPKLIRRVCQPVVPAGPTGRSVDDETARIDIASVRTDSAPVRADIKPTRIDIASMRTDDEVVTPRTSDAPEWRSPREHALELLRWLRGPNGRTGWFTVEELQTIHGEMLIDVRWQPLPWTGIGRELRSLLQQPKHYRWQDGRHVRVYLIEPARPGGGAEPAHVVGRTLVEFRKSGRNPAS